MLKKKRDLEFCTVNKRALLMKRMNVNNMRLLSCEYMDFEVSQFLFEYSTGFQSMARGTNWKLWLVVVVMSSVNITYIRTISKSPPWSRFGNHYNLYSYLHRISSCHQNLGHPCQPRAYIVIAICRLEKLLSYMLVFSFCCPSKGAADYEQDWFPQTGRWQSLHAPVVCYR